VGILGSRGEEGEQTKKKETEIPIVFWWLYSWLLVLEIIDDAVVQARSTRCCTRIRLHYGKIPRS